ncbi:hypothetical protein [Rhizobium mayense]|uniref:Uncharacterized protein n=1 Tax=Rhizobium mayense TaxID=1312184 RepID=A0ABT7K355_9HYPH|nr:hypothetical protein [Rhizobium mayense]MDL2401584.1 hypothetical protein [Rhizobium mayense]
MPEIIVIAVKIFGALIIVAAFVVFHRSNEKKAASILMAVMIFVGLALIMHERIAEVTLGRFGTFKLLRDQVSADAGVIQALKTRVENQSATVDAVAAQAKNAAGLSEKAASQINIADQKLANLNATLSAAKVTLENLERDADFAKTIEQAQNDDRVAFDKLSSIASDQNSPYAKRAADAWSVIMDAHSQGIYESNFTIPWPVGVNPATYSLADLKQLFASAPTAFKPAVLEYISKRDDIPKLQKLDFLMEVMKTDASLKAVEYAGRYFTTDTDLKIKPLALDYLSNWWSEHRKDYEITALEPK